MTSGEGHCGDIDYRPLTPDDEAAVRVLCAECFPISYPDRWYLYITSDKVFSMGAFNGRGTLVGMVVGEIQPLEHLEGEVGVVIERSEINTTVMYIISLGVTSHYRRRGIGRHLMTSLLDHVTLLFNCLAVYLHVLASNTQAIDFYHKQSFTTVCRIPHYYMISQKPADGLLLVLYVNGGEPFSNTLSAYVRRYVTESVGCRVTWGLCDWLAGWAKAAIARDTRDKFLL